MASVISKLPHAGATSPDSPAADRQPLVVEGPGLGLIAQIRQEAGKPLPVLPISDRNYMAEVRLIATEGTYAAALQGVLMCHEHYVVMCRLFDDHIDARAELVELLVDSCAERIRERVREIVSEKA